MRELVVRLEEEERRQRDPAPVANRRAARP